MNRRRKNNLSQSIMIVIGIVFIVILVALIFGGMIEYYNCKTLDEKILLLKQQKDEIIEKIEIKKKELIRFEEAEVARLKREKIEEEKLKKKERERNSVYNLSAGTILENENIVGCEKAYFQSYEITEGDKVYERIIGKSYVPNANIELSELRYLKILHFNFSHELQMGELIVNAQISDEILDIFTYLYQNEYEIESMRLIDDYWQGDGESSDNASIQANNTSAFCYRLVTGGQTLSKHAYGFAIDLNPQQNPYVTYNVDGIPECYHENAYPYIDRTIDNPHVLVSGDICCSIFESYGYEWGGYWTNPIDYQHFQKNDIDIIENQG